MESIEFDVTGQLNTFNKLSDSMGFIISKSINDLAKERGRKALANHLSDKLNIKNRAVSRPSSIRVDFSNKNNLDVGLFFQLGRDSGININKWIGLQQYGGTETASGGKLAIPLRDNLARFAGVPRNKNIPKSLRISTIMSKAPSKRDKSRVYTTKGIKPVIGKRGVWARTSEGFKLLYIFKNKAEHSKKSINFQKAMEKTFNTNLERYINRQYLRLLKK